EQLAEAAQKRDALLARVGHAGEGERVAYLLHGGRDTQSLAAALGFGYAWDPGSEQYAHPSVAFVLTPEGRIARYLYGIQFPAATIAEALAAARSGAAPTERAGTLTSEILRCFRFDPALRRYGPRLRAYYRIGGVSLLLIVVALFS